ncbi:MAG: pyridoxamine 5'-phosphate oxidase [Planctomycetaceae bacterium]|nr:pyridoxamine 5'-phosphate oxidase [Planctomycetaceae bacterium]
MTDDPMYLEAIDRFAAVIAEAKQLDLKDPTVMALATVGVDGRPSVRMVLMRGFDERGINFFTNVGSRKGQELAANTIAAVCFHWEPLLKQIRIEGAVEMVSDEETDAYWNSRPRDSRIGAWASDQSQPLDRRETLEARVAEFDAKFPGDDIPRPDFWRGYRIIPDRIEFWHSRNARLHDREVYERTANVWTRMRLYP